MVRVVLRCHRLSSAVVVDFVVVAVVVVFVFVVIVVVLVVTTVAPEATFGMYRVMQQLWRCHTSTRSYSSLCHQECVLRHRHARHPAVLHRRSIVRFGVVDGAADNRGCVRC